MTTESPTLTDDDLRAMLAEVLHEHLAVRWVEGHESFLQRKWEKWGWEGRPGNYQDAPASWALVVYIDKVTDLHPRGPDDDPWALWYMPDVGTVSMISSATCHRFPALPWMTSLARCTTRAWLADFHARQARVQSQEGTS